MTKKKNIRERGKIRFSDYFRNFKNGETVAIVTEQTVPSSYPVNVTGRTGTVIGSRGSHKVIAMKDGNLMKTYIVHPIHLKKIQQAK